MVSPHDVGYLEQRRTHAYAQSLGLIAACDGTAVVVREHDDRPSVQIGTEQTLARDEEVVAVGKGIHDVTPFLSRK